jgi:hypothetical protein
MAQAATMDSAPADFVNVIDFRRQGMFLRWQIANGKWVACDVPPPVVHGIALIRAAGPNICLFGRGGQLHLQVGTDLHLLSGNSLRIKCRPILASLGLRKRFTIEDGTRVVYRHSYWTGQSDDFFRWLAARAGSAQWRQSQGTNWSAGAPAAGVRAS